MAGRVLSETTVISANPESTDVIQFTLTLKMTTAQVLKRQSLSTTTALFRITLTPTITFHLLMQPRSQGSLLPAPGNEVASYVMTRGFKSYTAL